MIKPFHLGCQECGGKLERIYFPTLWFQCSCCNKLWSEENEFDRYAVALGKAIYTLKKITRGYSSAYVMTNQEWIDHTIYVSLKALAEIELDQD